MAIKLHIAVMVISRTKIPLSASGTRNQNEGKLSRCALNANSRADSPTRTGTTIFRARQCQLNLLMWRCVSLLSWMSAACSVLSFRALLSACSNSSIFSCCSSSFFSSYFFVLPNIFHMLLNIGSKLIVGSRHTQMLISEILV